MVHYPPIELYGLKLEKVENDLNRNRNELRQLVIKKIWNEIPGEGKGEKTAHYSYYVEKLLNSKRIFLTRPAIRRQGFDFLIHVEDYQFLTGRDSPKHVDIINDLQRKKDTEPEKYKKLKVLLEKIFLCEDTDDLLNKENISFDCGFPVDLILKVCKWFFIEQDIRYWNYSGRGMLKEGIDNI
jgi:hypothetical protein